MWIHQMFPLSSRQCHCVYKCNTIGLSSLCIAPVFVPKVESGERADVPKVELGEQRVEACRTCAVPHQIGTWAHLKQTKPMPNWSWSVPWWTTSRCGPVRAKANLTIPPWAPERISVPCPIHWYATCPTSGAIHTKRVPWRYIVVRSPQKMPERSQSEPPWHSVHWSGTVLYGKFASKSAWTWPVCRWAVQLSQ